MTFGTGFPHSGAPIWRKHIQGAQSMEHLGSIISILPKNFQMTEREQAFLPDRTIRACNRGRCTYV
ncbi:hypothetical protein SS1G_08764 [Sclerotinia sclerotiorum 1980 UF-70]|uniref:Uncharacterized protein n=1 Tax=Sclerotinia sclerotiorum (strain ATCC 18683 / 1980 / Ss-1) TaxID=665079 RepID=A7ETV7_SCLS1|nr:hypothetical protein SS1G_08764 [Sclerotinia sclerotiorum 1980 UF-70]EDN92899.1 hypothetical protein SS1G_08764 [Sclerotinia sclerotiorum 1980 UF-70]